IAKPRLHGDEKPVVQYVLWHVLETALRLMHPFMPFITEEIWQSIPHEGESIMVADFPKADSSLADPDAERKMETVMEIIRSIRNLRAELGVAPGKKVDATIVATTPEARSAVESGSPTIESLGKVSSLTLGDAKPSEEGGQFVSAHMPGADIYLPMAGLVDVEKEAARIAKELGEVEKDLARSEGKLSNEQFTSKAPAAVIEKEQRIVAELTGKRDKLQERLRMLKG
ncbi:MAG TPA: class I tRNA ligase family protein, partial [Armatimonadota bacterium]